MGDGLDTGRRGGSLSGGVFSGGPRASNGDYSSFYWAVPLDADDRARTHPGSAVLPAHWWDPQASEDPDRVEDYWVPALACVAYPAPAASPAEPRWALHCGFADLYPVLPAESRLRRFAPVPPMEFALVVERGPLVPSGGVSDDAARTSVYRPSGVAPLVVFELVGTRPRAAVAQLGDRLLLDWRHS